DSCRLLFGNVLRKPIEPSTRCHRFQMRSALSLLNRCKSRQWSL
ncbi:hypothetical protein D047_1348, partial [Vibrio parahaemolyticus VPTS-2010_2]